MVKAFYLRRRMPKSASDANPVSKPVVGSGTTEKLTVSNVAPFPMNQVAADDGESPISAKLLFAKVIDPAIGAPETYEGNTATYGAEAVTRKGSPEIDVGSVGPIDPSEPATTAVI